MRRFVFALALCLLFGAPVGFLGAAPRLEWDERLDALGVTLQPALDCSGGCWKLIAARYEDDQQSGGNHNIFARIFDESGDMVAGAP